MIEAKASAGSRTSDFFNQPFFEYAIPETPPSNFDVLGTAASLNWFCRFSSAAQDRLWVKAMYLLPGQASNIVVQNMEEAAGRRVNTRGIFDQYTVLKARAKKPKVLATLDGLKSSGVAVELVNRAGVIRKTLPEFHADHRKVIIIDQKALFIEFNISDDNFRSADIAVEVDELSIVNPLAEVFDRKFPLKQDLETNCDNETFLLEDCGQMGQSLILKRAVELVADARESVRLISPYLPDGAMQEALFLAYQRDVDVEAIMPPYAMHHSRSIFGLINEIARFTAALRGFKIPIRLHDRWMHAKLLIVDGKVAIIGSHNFTNKGVAMGTIELSMQSSNPNLVQNLANFYQGLRQDTHQPN
jgi:cardiolipin synthase A/B